jgi:hypothetical protein
MWLLDIFFGRRARTTLPAMKLGIKVTVSGDIAKPSAIYTLVLAEPEMETHGPIVSPDGDVNLRALPLNAAFDSRTEITFELVGKVRCKGVEHVVEFRRPACVAFRIRREDGGRPTPGQFRAFFAKPRSQSRLTVDDQNNDDGHYQYCLRIRAKGCRRGFGKLDPSIINR